MLLNAGTMVVMKGLLVLLLAVTCVVSKYDPGLRVKFNVGFNPGNNFFFNVPRTIAAAIHDHWSLTPRPSGPLASLSMYCHPDLTVCALFDDNGKAAGLQIALDQTELKNNKYDMKQTGFVEWAVTLRDGSIRRFWAIQMYFVDQEYLNLPAADREASYDDSKLLQQDSLWLTGFNGTVDRISSKDSDIQESVFTRQACIPWMGRHYYHKMTKSTQCRADTMYPWFPLTDSGNLIAVGMMVIGSYPVKESRDWFEHPPRLAVSTIVPEGPECLYQLAENPGVTTMHVYFINTPWGVGCPLWRK
ncbi:uncharacterized protein LOC116773315 [Danaus plexippus]|uniref:uncharacterized protein LOC116773315 n=1 Tax=Danaus plexippus TaxID=13037 RepID=UPI002AB094AD|nr:uncharacterized protein LOC116773315 [Danaus plexippus]